MQCQWYDNWDTWIYGFRTLFNITRASPIYYIKNVLFVTEKECFYLGWWVTRSFGIDGKWDNVFIADGLPARMCMCVYVCSFQIELQIYRPYLLVFVIHYTFPITKQLQSRIMYLAYTAYNGW